MIEFLTKTEKKSLILFVHGFTGGGETWNHAEHGYFYDLLAADGFVKENFDIAKFEYFTKLLNMFASSSAKFA